VYGVASGARSPTRHRMRGVGSARADETEAHGRETHTSGKKSAGKERGSESLDAPIPLSQVPHQNSMRFEKKERGGERIVGERRG